MRIDRVWAMPNRRTFQIKPIRQLIQDELGPDIVDPFPFQYRHDALEYLSGLPSASASSVVFDPPYSPYQLKKTYQSLGLSVGDHGSANYWMRCKNEMARIMKPSGKSISFGWNSNGVGKKRGFTITRILLVSHGAMHNDTICTVEQKIQTSLEFA